MSNFEHGHDTICIRVSYIRQEHDTNTNWNFNCVQISFNIVAFHHLTPTHRLLVEKVRHRC